jgi:hypothetical protein
MRKDRTVSKYQIKQVKGSWKLIREGTAIFTGLSKESCERWLHISTRYPFGIPLEAEE